jgi:hypothetical protein
MKTISIHAYWAWAIIAGHKRFENRSWRTTHRGQLAIHCTKSKVADELAIQTICQAGIEPPSLEEIVWGLIRLIPVVSLSWTDWSRGLRFNSLFSAVLNA